MSDRVAAVLGVGPGLSAAVARRFAGEAGPTAPAPRGKANFSALAVGKFGLRALAQSINTPRVRAMFPGREDHTFLSPDAIAETYWQLHSQDQTAWTLELDLRPSVESF